MKRALMQLATVRIHDTEVLSIACARLDAHTGATLLGLVAASVERGARKVVLDLGPTTVIDVAGARAVGEGSLLLGAERRLVLAGLSVRARTVLRSAGIAGRVQMVDWWTDAVEPLARAA